MEYEVGKNFELINEKLDAILAKLYPKARQIKKEEGEGD